MTCPLRVRARAQITASICSAACLDWRVFLALRTKKYGSVIWARALSGAFPLSSSLSTRVSQTVVLIQSSTGVPPGSPLCHTILLECLGSLANPPLPGGSPPPASDSRSPPSPDSPDRLGHRLTLIRQHVNLPQLAHDLFRRMRLLPAHPVPPYDRRSLYRRATSTRSGQLADRQTQRLTPCIKNLRILLAKSAAFGPAAALSGFPSGGRPCRSACSPPRPWRRYLPKLLGALSYRHVGIS